MSCFLMILQCLVKFDPFKLEVSTLPFCPVLYRPVKTILWTQIQIHAQLLLCQLINLISTDRSVQGVYKIFLGQKHWNRGFGGVWVFFIISERKPRSFKSNSSYLVTSITCVDFDIEDIYSMRDDIKCSSWACRKAEDLFDMSSKKLWSSTAHAWLMYCTYLQLC